jgi:hypothetical protein
MIELTPEQTKAYNKFIALRNRIRHGKEWVKPSEILETVDVPGLNHPMYAPNSLYIEYQDAFKAWLAVSPHNQNKTLYGADNEV